MSSAVRSLQHWIEAKTHRMVVRLITNSTFCQFRYELQIADRTKVAKHRVNYITADNGQSKTRVLISLGRFLIKVVARMT